MICFLRMNNLVRAVLCALAWQGILAGAAQAASFGINFSGGGPWSPHYLNQVGDHGSGPYPSAFGVTAADWYEPGTVGNTFQLEGAPSAVNFQPASMGAGSVNIGFESNHGFGGGAAFTTAAYGFANANSWVMEEDGSGNRLLDANGHWIPVLDNDGNPIPDTDDGIPPSGEYAVLSGALFGVAQDEYASDPAARDIIVTISGLNSIASSYQVTLWASAFNGEPQPSGTKGFTPATVMDNAGHSDTAEFTLLPDRPSWFEVWTPDPESIYVSVAGEASSEVAFTGDTLTIRLSGPNSTWSFPENVENMVPVIRTALAGLKIEYTPIASQPGDFDGDGDVDGADFVAWQTNFPKATDATLAQGDADGDGDVDGADFVVWQTNFPFTPSPSVAPVPEPTACWLLATGSVMIVAGRIAKARKRSARTGTIKTA